MILLTPEEMSKADQEMPDEFEDIEDDKEAWFYDRRNIAKAQARKLIDELEKYNRSEGRSHAKSSALTISAFKWNQFKAELAKEIE